MTALLRTLLAAAVFAQAPAPEPLIRDTAVSRVSEHVHVISDLNVGLVPNVGIIVGTEATLVVAPLQPLQVVPSHGPVGEASLIAEQRTMMTAIQSRAIALKREGKPADETAQMVQSEFQAKYPGWAVPVRLGVIARTAYTEAP